MKSFCLGGCGRVIPRGPYCTECKRRDGSTRRWRSIRLQVLERDRGQCQLRRADGELCLEPAEHVDHIVEVRNGGTDDLHNLRASCAIHNLTRAR